MLSQLTFGAANGDWHGGVVAAPMLVFQGEDLLRRQLLALSNHAAQKIKKNRIQNKKKKTDKLNIKIPNVKDNSRSISIFKKIRTLFRTKLVFVTV